MRIVAVNHAHGIVELKAVFETEAAARIERQHPAVLNEHTDTGRDLDAAARRQLEVYRREEIIPGGTARRAARQLQTVIRDGSLFNGLLREGIQPVRNELLRRHLFKFCNAKHICSSGYRVQRTILSSASDCLTLITR